MIVSSLAINLSVDNFDFASQKEEALGTELFATEAAELLSEPL